MFLYLAFFSFLDGSGLACEQRCLRVWSGDCLGMLLFM